MFSVYYLIVFLNVHCLWFTLYILLKYTVVNKIE